MKRLTFIFCILLCLSATFSAEARHDDPLKIAPEMLDPSPDPLQQALLLEVGNIRNSLVVNPDDIDLDRVENILQNGDTFTIMCLSEVLAMVDIRQVKPGNIRQFYIPASVRIVRILNERLDFLKTISMGRTDFLIYWEGMTESLRDYELAQAFMEVQIINHSILNYISEVGGAARLEVEEPCLGYGELHFLEFVLYGKDEYMQSIDPVSKKLWKRLDKKLGFSDVFDTVGISSVALLEVVERHFQNDNYELLSNNAYDIITASLQICCSTYLNRLSQLLSASCQQMGRTEEDWYEMIYQVFKERYTSEYVDMYYSAAALSSKENLDSSYNGFCALQQEMMDKGYEWAQVLPHELTDEQWEAVRNDEEFQKYIVSLCKAFKSMLVGLQVTDLSQSYAINMLRDSISDKFNIDNPAIFGNQVLSYSYEMLRIGEDALGMELMDLSLNYLERLGVANMYTLAISLLHFDDMADQKKVERILFQSLLPYVEGVDFKSTQVKKDEAQLYGEMMSCAITAEMLYKRYPDRYSEKADEIVDKVLLIYDLLEKDGFKYDLCLRLFSCYLNKKEYQDALTWAEKAMSLDVGGQSVDQLQALLFQVYYKTGRFAEAADCGAKFYSSELCSPQVVPSWFYAQMAECYAALGDMESMCQYIDCYMISVRRNVEGRLFKSGAYIREQYWNSLKESETSFANACWSSLSSGSNAEIIAPSLYDWALLSKGLLLEADNKVNELLSTHPDPDVRTRYKQMLELSSKVDDMTLSDTDSMRVVLWRGQISKAEQDLMRVLRAEDFDVKIYGWKDVQECLHDGEAAVEFKRLPDGEDFRYVALVLKRGWKSPKLVRLALESELMAINTLDPSQDYNQRLYRDDSTMKKLYSLLWSPLETYFVDGEPVWFSVDGKLLLYNMEILRASDGRLGDEKYDLRRLSSTRELCRERGYGEVRKAVLYGGLNYKMGESEVREASKAYLERSLVRSRGSFKNGEVPRDPLPETLFEVQDIAELLSEREVDTLMRVGNAGVEQSFKALSGEKIDVMHLATHGFYMEGKVDYQSGDEELSPMMRAGLMLSGPKEKGVEDAEDGILLAREIADMDLSNVQLVVLSACQTASGAISDDGVFGIQRGFKQAGAGTIIMTLWEVNSEMTMSFMLHFYKNLAGGMSKREAFKDARSAVREEYHERLDWSAFIMLD